MKNISMKMKIFILSANTRSKEEIAVATEYLNTLTNNLSSKLEIFKT